MARFLPCKTRARYKRWRVPGDRGDRVGTGYQICERSRRRGPGPGGPGGPYFFFILREKKSTVGIPRPPPDRSEPGDPVRPVPHPIGTPRNARPGTSLAVQASCHPARNRNLVPGCAHWFPSTETGLQTIN